MVHRCPSETPCRLCPGELRFRRTFIPPFPLDHRPSLPDTKVYSLSESDCAIDLNYTLHDHGRFIIPAFRSPWILRRDAF